MTDIKQKARKMFDEKLSKLRGLRPHLDFTELLDIHDQIIDIAIAEERKTTLKEIEEEAKQYEQFILNVLDGIDVADYQMQKDGGGTKAIRFALKSRVSPSQLIHQKLIK